MSDSKPSTESLNTQTDTIIPYCPLRSYLPSRNVLIGLTSITILGGSVWYYLRK